jgi:hypothetical protein
MQKKLENDKIFCHLLYSDGDISSNLIFARYQIPDDLARTQFLFGSSVLGCILEKSVNDTLRFPIAVGLTYNSENLIPGVTNFTTIRYSKNLDDKFLYQLAICGPILKRNFNNSLRLVEFIEFYRILGATKFYFYIESIADEAAKVLKYYEDNEIAEIFRWDTRIVSEKDIYNYGFTAAINECNYRAGFFDNAKYAGTMDVDEILMPLANDTYTLLDLIEKIDDGKQNSFIFKNVFVKSGRRLFDEINNKNDHNFLYANSLTQRGAPFKIRTRSKYIVRGRFIIALWNHATLRVVKGTSERHIRDDEGFSYHYRDRAPVEEPVLDESAKRYVQVLSSRVDQVCMEIFNDFCNLVIHEEYHNKGWSKFGTVQI